MLQNRIPRRTVAAAGLTLLGCTSANAALMSYTDFTVFESELAASGLTAKRQGFDDISAGTVINTGDVLGGFTFSGISLVDGQLAVVAPTDSTETRSPPNAIGTDGPADQQMRNPDSFTLTFPDSYAFGLWFIAEPDFAADDDFSVTLPDVAGEPSQGSVAADAVELNDNFSSWFIGFTDSASPFTKATIASTDDFSEGTFLFRVDDFYTAEQAPLPTTLALLALGAGILGFRLRRTG